MAPAAATRSFHSYHYPPSSAPSPWNGMGWMGRDGMDGMGWMGWDGTGWDGMGRDGMDGIGWDGGPPATWPNAKFLLTWNHVSPQQVEHPAPAALLLSKPAARSPSIPLLAHRQMPASSSPSAGGNTALLLKMKLWPQSPAPLCSLVLQTPFVPEDRCSHPAESMHSHPQAHSGWKGGGKPAIPTLHMARDRGRKLSRSTMWLCIDASKTQQ